jgi:hypothetical protein
VFNAEIDSPDHRPEENGMMLDLRLDERLLIRDHEEAEAEGIPTVSGMYFRTRNNPSILLSGSSQSYLFFWDKLNEANYYLGLSIQHADLPLEDWLVYHLSDDLISNGGQ